METLEEFWSDLFTLYREIPGYDRNRKGICYMTDKLPKREEVAQELTWRLEDIYDDEAKWEEDLKKVYEVSKTIASYQGKLSDGADTASWRNLRLRTHERGPGHSQFQVSGYETARNVSIYGCC